jgi:hypothetical protein
MSSGACAQITDARLEAMSSPKSLRRAKDMITSTHFYFPPN